MTTVLYPYGPGSYDTAQLDGEIIAAGLPAPAYLNGSGYTGPGSPATDIEIAYAAPLDAAQKALLDQTVANHVPAGPRRPRLIFDVYHDIGALTGSQKTKIWADLQSGTPPKWTQDRGPNAADLHILWLLATQLSVVNTAADKQTCQAMLMSIYTVDNPTFLVHPAFDTTINIPGDEPVP